MPFDAIGLPGFQFIQDPLDYGTHIYEIRYTIPGVLDPGDDALGRRVHELEHVVGELELAAVAATPLVDVVGISVWGNGASTNYGSFPREAAECGPGGLGMYCRGRAGVDLQQVVAINPLVYRWTKELPMDPGELTRGLDPVAAEKVIRVALIQHASLPVFDDGSAGSKPGRTGCPTRKTSPNVGNRPDLKPARSASLA